MVTFDATVATAQVGRIGRRVTSCVSAATRGDSGCSPRMARHCWCARWVSTDSRSRAIYVPTLGAIPNPRASTSNILERRASSCSIERNGRPSRPSAQV